MTTWSSLRLVTAGLMLGVATVSSAQSQRIEPAEVRCPSVLGVGVDTGRTYCDVLIGTEAVSYTHLTLPTKRMCRSRWSPYH